MTNKSVLSQFANLGEDVLGKLAENPTASRILQSAMEMKERVDELARRVRGLEAMEQRLEALEARVVTLEGGEASTPVDVPAAIAATAPTTAAGPAGPETPLE